jgi:hypothetical protein
MQVKTEGRNGLKNRAKESCKILSKTACRHKELCYDSPRLFVVVFNLSLSGGENNVVHRRYFIDWHRNLRSWLFSVDAERAVQGLSHIE